MSYSLIVRIDRLGNLISFYESLVVNSEFDLYGELKCADVSKGRNIDQFILCQAAYKSDEIYNSHFFESMSKEEFDIYFKKITDAISADP